MAKVSVAFMQLGSCWGCHQSLLDLHEELLDILPLLDIKFWQAVVDTKESDLEAMPDKSIEIGFVEGHIRTEHDVHSLKLIRKKSKTLVAFGACSTNGGVASLANSYPIEDNIKRKFHTADTVVTANTPTENVPAFSDKVIPNDEIIQVDAYLYGCPPKRENIKAAVYGVVLALYGEYWLDTNVCGVCEMKGDACLLNKGVPCFGSVTGAPPGLKWTAARGPCMGEYGMTKNISMDEAVKLTNFVDGLTEVSAAVGKIAIEFVTLYFRLPALGSLVLPIDPLQAVAQGKLGQYPLDRLAGGGDGLALDVPEAIRKFAVIALTKLDSAKVDSGNKNVCDHCERKILGPAMKINGYKRDYEGIMDPKICLLNQGYWCMGFITRAGCGATCPTANMVCSGCYGPSVDIIGKPEAILTKVSALGGDVNQVLDKRGLFYRYNYAGPNKTESLDK